MSALPQLMAATCADPLQHARPACSYMRKLQGRPLHALASRICSMNEVLHLPPRMNAWMVGEAHRCGIEAALILMPPGSRLSQSGVYRTAHALESAGIPALTVSADMVASAGWDREKLLARVAEFLARAKRL